MRKSRIQQWALTIALAMVASTAAAQSVVRVSGTISSNTTWTANNAYLLQGAVFVGSGATLTIEPGTTIYGEFTSTGTLVVSRGGRIIADGTRERPIVFTSDRPVGQRSRANWGGLILCGNAPINVPGGTAEGEGDTGVYGGNDPNDSSGILRYVRVEYAGIEFSPDNELNGIAFQGVGDGTLVDYVQVHFNKDDGIEFFGGTVNAKHLLVTAAADDSFDWTDGWTGKGQFWIAQQRGDDADNGFESDNNGENNELQPRSNPTIYNVTLIGAPTTQHGTESDLGMLIRAGTAGTFRNFIVTGFKEWGVEIDNPSTFAQAASGAMSLHNSIISGNLEGACSDDADESGGPPSTTTADYCRSIWPVISGADPMLADPLSLIFPNFQPLTGSPAITGAVPFAVPPDDGFFEPITFIGAMGGGPNDDWTQGWTSSTEG